MYMCWIIKPFHSDLLSLSSGDPPAHTVEFSPRVTDPPTTGALQEQNDILLGLFWFVVLFILWHYEVSPLIWFWVFRSGSSVLSSSGSSSESEGVLRSRFKRFSGISGIRGRMAWLFLFNVLKSFDTCGFKGFEVKLTFSMNGPHSSSYIVNHIYDLTVVNHGKETVF